ncbi:MAG: phytanoyl-CoA dioxygenase family protein [Cytophagales bacterium]|nr:MAG: phytanoyl-CoA dioxygenase family protein [Cytophagales bacterium]
MKLTSAQIAQYHTNGYLIVKELFSSGEISLLYGSATEDEAVSQNAYNVVDSTGRNSKMTLWFTPGDDPFGQLVRSERMVSAVEDLLGAAQPPQGAKVCHFHSKLMQKESRVGGAWEWHQDYGYWYKNGFLFPEQMLSAMVALTPANAENGCLQVISGSHRMGRVEHGFAGEQVGANLRFVEESKKYGKHLFMELEAGDVLFFHSNILHRSEANLSDRPRWSFISAYNLSTNVPFNEKSTACITPLETVPDEAVLQSALSSSGIGKEFLSKEADVTLK